MVAIWFVAVILGVGLVGLLAWRRRTSAADRQERPVLPAHYSALVETDRSRYPGLCSDCGTENTPGYNYCRECGERLPGGTRGRSDTDVSQIFNE